jgi:hypothetical protein
LATIPSYRPKNPEPLVKLLEDEYSWNALIADVKAYIESYKAKRMDGKGVVKPFHITRCQGYQREEANWKSIAGIIFSFKMVSDSSDLCDQASGKKRGLDSESEAQRVMLFAALRGNTCARSTRGPLLFSPMVIITTLQPVT